jgi:hypothetical protein
MRIPSSLTEDNLYSRHNRRAKEKSPYRLLMRLVLAMVLVIAVMRQAGNPRIYEAFFPPPVVDIAAQAPVVTPLPTARPDENRLLVGDRDPQIDLEAIFAQAEKMMRMRGDQLDQALVLLGDEKNAELMTLVAQWRRAGDVETPVLSKEWADRIDAAFVQAGQTVDRQSGENKIEPLDWTAAPDVPLLQSALDRWAISRVDPAAVWKGVDTLGFYRLLEDDPQRRPEDAASRTSVTSLIQQPEVYLRRRVVLPASVARAIRRPAAKNPFGVEQYWEVWLRPRDGSERPFVMFTGEVSETIAAISPDSALTDGPQVWVDGIFLKRIAYQSSLGRELAPAIVGTLLEPATSSDVPVAVTPPSSTEGWLLVALSALIGCSAAALIFFQSGKAIVRSRALRQKTHPPAPPFLASPDQADHRDGEPGEALP